MYSMEGRCVSVTCFDGSQHTCGFNCSSLLQNKQSSGNYTPRPQPRGPTPAELERDRVLTVHEWENLAFEAYQRDDYVSAASYYQKALEYDPYNVGLSENLSVSRLRIREAQERRVAEQRAAQRAAERRIAEQRLAEQKATEESQQAVNAVPQMVQVVTNPAIPGYLSSVNTALELVSLTPSLLILHPSPHVRAEAQKGLVEATLKKVTEASAVFALNQQLRKGKLEPMRWDTEAEKERKRQEALRHSKEVDGLRLKAFQEAEQQADALKETMLRSNVIGITPGPALSELLRMTTSKE